MWQGSMKEVNKPLNEYIFKLVKNYFLKTTQLHFSFVKSAVKDALQNQTYCGIWISIHRKGITRAMFVL